MPAPPRGHRGPEIQQGAALQSNQHWLRLVLGRLSGRYLPGETLYFTSNDTFVKANYPGLRAVRVKAQGAGGAGGGTNGAEQAGEGGGGGGYAESLILASALGASETITVGVGGTGGSGIGTNGGPSSFGAYVSADDGRGGTGRIDATSNVLQFTGGAGGNAANVGDLVIPGDYGGGYSIMGAETNVNPRSGHGGSSHLGATISGSNTDEFEGLAGRLYGGGGSGASTTAGTTARIGGDGGDGIVIVELLF